MVTMLKSIINAYMIKTFNVEKVFLWNELFSNIHFFIHFICKYLINYEITKPVSGFLCTQLALICATCNLYNTQHADFFAEGEKIFSNGLWF